MNKKEIIWALQHTDKGTSKEQTRASKIIGALSAHPKWSETVRHRCPLCGYVTSATNIHKDCPQNPTEHAVPMYVVEEEIPKSLPKGAELYYSIKYRTGM
ncbi:MAG TPA: hypothetical protein VMW36_00805 [Patescibacteria group bacterium]|nr:hypothetical protein [Patescibacteria group bacterium]